MRKLGDAEKKALQASILKAFLLRAEGLGWINSAGHLKMRHHGRAHNFWMSVKVTLDVQRETRGLFADDFYQRLEYHDPIVAARGMHAELCVQMRTAVAA